MLRDLPCAGLPRSAAILFTLELGACRGLLGASSGLLTGYQAQLANPPLHPRHPRCARAQLRIDDDADLRPRDPGQRPDVPILEALTRGDLGGGMRDRSDLRDLSPREGLLAALVDPAFDGEWSRSTSLVLSYGANHLRL